LADISAIITYDLAQVNISEAVNFLVQTSNTGSVCTIILKMLKKKLQVPDRAVNTAIDYALKEKMYDSAMAIVRVLIANNKWNSQSMKEIVRNLLIYGQQKSVCEILEKLSLDVTGVHYIWENFLEFCCNKDLVKMFRELMERICSRVLPHNISEITAIYNLFLERMMNSNFTLPTIKMTMEDVARFRLKIKGSIVKDGLVRIIEENPDPRSFVHKILIFRYNIDAYTYAHMISRLVTLDKKVEVLTLVDLIMGENVFLFSWSDLNLNPNDLKYVVKYQSLSIKLLKEEWRKGLDSPNKLERQPVQSDTMSIIDQLSMDDFEPLQNEDFEFLDSLTKDKDDKIPQNTEKLL